MNENKNVLKDDEGKYISDVDVDDECSFIVPVVDYPKNDDCKDKLR